jgi:hypothetical protein
MKQMASRAFSGLCSIISQKVELFITFMLHCSILLQSVNLTLLSASCRLCATSFDIHSSTSPYCISLHVSAKLAIIRCINSDEGIWFCLCNDLDYSGLYGLSCCCHACVQFMALLVWCVALLNVFVGVDVCCLAVAHHGYLW